MLTIAIMFVDWLDVLTAGFYVIPCDEPKTSLGLLSSVTISRKDGTCNRRAIERIGEFMYTSAGTLRKRGRELISCFFTSAKYSAESADE
jgi:hypothetical protein